MGFSLKKLAGGLFKTKENLVTKIKLAVGLHQKIDDDFLDEIEEILIGADISVEVALAVIDNLKIRVAERGVNDPQAVIDLLKECLLEVLPAAANGSFFDFSEKPLVMMIVGVNGTGKTTAIAKIARRLVTDGKQVTLTAADTFRAAAIDQLAIWAERVGCHI
ncbi:MAG: signal recognition particle receptor subunit alpha, partial [candidate division Zixibacteria bacterium]|nr:signal recognition particle receptor subunit alpha [candidate division Zixibacteria bacterium]